MRSLSMQKALAQKRVDMMVRHGAEKTELCLRVFSKFILWCFVLYLGTPTKVNASIR